MMSTSASLAPCTAPAWTDFQNSCDVALGTTAISSLSRAGLLGLAGSRVRAIAAADGREQSQGNTARNDTAHEMIRLLERLLDATRTTMAYVMITLRAGRCQRSADCRSRCGQIAVAAARLSFCGRGV